MDDHNDAIDRIVNASIVRIVHPGCDAMSRVLITNGYVVTVDAARNVYPNGFVAVDGPTISAVGSSAQTPKVGSFDEVIDASGSIVVPGLIRAVSV